MQQLGWTTLEQSKKLVEAGLDPNTADMSVFEAEGKQYVYAHKPDDINCTPCWSLGALLNVMDSPKIFYRIECTCGETEVHVSGSGFYKYFDNIIDTIFWLLENGYIEKV
jgi:hypothetical protein